MLNVRARSGASFTLFFQLDHFVPQKFPEFIMKLSHLFRIPALNVNVLAVAASGYSLRNRVLNGLRNGFKMLVKTVDSGFPVCAAGKVMMFGHDVVFGRRTSPIRFRELRFYSVLRAQPLRVGCCQIRWNEGDS